MPTARARRGRRAGGAARRRRRRSRRGGSGARRRPRRRNDPFASTWSARSGWAARAMRTGSSSQPGSIFRRTRAAPAAAARSTSSRSTPVSWPGGMPTTAPTGMDSKPLPVSNDCGQRPALRPQLGVGHRHFEGGGEDPVDRRAPEELWHLWPGGEPAASGGGRPREARHGGVCRHPFDRGERRVDAGAVGQRSALAPALSFVGDARGRRARSAAGAPRLPCRRRPGKGRRPAPARRRPASVPRGRPPRHGRSGLVRSGVPARMAEWQTRRPQKPLSERACGFESRSGHALAGSPALWATSAPCAP